MFLYVADSSCTNLVLAVINVEGAPTDDTVHMHPIGKGPYSTGHDPAGRLVIVRVVYLEDDRTVCWPTKRTGGHDRVTMRPNIAAYVFVRIV